MSIFSKLTGMPSVTEIIGGVMGVALLASAGWGARVNNLRAEHKTNIDAVVTQLKAAGTVKADEAHAADSVKLLVAQLAGESAANTVTTGSLTECLASLKAKSDESDLRAKALADATAGYQADLAKLKKDGAGQATKLAYWQGMADKYQAVGKCPVSADLAKELNR